MVNLSLVIVTYNRLEKLKKSLQHYDQQSAGFTSLIVVNNASIDGTEEFLSEWVDAEASYKKYVINLPENMGGSGGFYEGQKFALSLNPDWIYVADDDAYADKDMIRGFYDFITHHNISNISAVCASVYNTDGSIAYEHRSYIKYKNHIRVIRELSECDNYKHPYFEIDLLSYVGSFINVDSLKRIGLVNPRYFIYSDDSEHSLRLKRCGEIFCVPQMVIIHDSGQNNVKADENIIVSWRDYYAIRNMLHMVLNNHICAAIYITVSYIKKIVFKYKYMHREERKLIINALVDAWCNNLGKHIIYAPGWQINKS